MHAALLRDKDLQATLLLFHFVLYVHLARKDKDLEEESRVCHALDDHCGLILMCIYISAASAQEEALNIKLKLWPNSYVHLYFCCFCTRGGIEY